MDWTGGSKRRFVIHERQGMLQRQRAHFAKARSTVRNLAGSQRSPRRDKPIKRKGDGSPASRYEKRRKVSGLNHKHDTNGQSTKRLATRPGASRSWLQGVGETRTRYNSTDWHGSKKTWTSTLADALRSTNSQRRSHSDVRNPSRCANEFNTNGGQLQTPIDGGNCNRTAKAKQGSFIIISSQSSAESLLSEANSTLPRKERVNAVGEAKPLPLTVRQRLLARPDWLGLEALRPLQMHFQSNEDKSRVGKRRKVERSSKKGSTRNRPHNAISNLYHSYLRDVWDHQPLGPSDIRVKIGTEALSSQTRTHNTAPDQQTQPTSIRPMSVESQSLSEESMLLEAGEDLPTFANFDPEARLVDKLGSSPIQTQHGVASSHSSSYAANTGDTEDDGGLFRVSDSRGSPAASQNSEVLNGRLSQSTLGGPVRLSETCSIMEKDMDATACEQRWRSHLGVQARSSSKESMVALRSSGGCTTSSDVVRRRAVPGKVIAVPEDLECAALSDIHGASHSQTWQDPASNEAVASSTSSPTRGPSPCESFTLIRNLARASTPKRSSLQQVKGDDMIWRDFIIGSQSSDSGP